MPQPSDPKMSTLKPADVEDTALEDFILTALFDYYETKFDQLPIPHVCTD